MLAGKRPTEMPESEIPDTTEIADETPADRKLRTLVVDDEPAAQRVMVHMLASENLELRTAGGCRGAEAVLEDGFAPDLVVSDYRMPDGNGIELLRRIRERCPRAQRILISGHADLSMVQDAINDGTVHRFLTKPWEVETFLTTLRSAGEQVRVTEERDAFFAQLSERNVQLERSASELEEHVQTRTAQLEEAKKVWERTFDVFADPLSVTTGGYEVQRANLAYARTAGRDIRSVPGTRCHEVLFGKDAPCSTCPLASLQGGAQNGSTEVVDERKERIYETSAYLLSEADEVGDAQYVVLYRDITERRKLERQLLQSEKMAALGLLSGEIAHEINNPVGIILSFSQLALRSPKIKEEPQIQSFITEIEASARRCKSIIQNLLSFARPSRPGERSPLDLADVTGRTLQIAAAQLRGSRVQVRSEVPEDLPTTLGHPDQIQQVLLNLVTNAVQAMEGIDEQRSIVVSAREGRAQRGKRVVIVEVRDTGPGISPENVSRVFDPFFTTKPEGKGTGLGLSTSYRIVTDHGGHMEADNALEGGAIFRVVLPVAAAPAGKR